MNISDATYNMLDWCCIFTTTTTTRLQFWQISGKIHYKTVISRHSLIKESKFNYTPLRSLELPVRRLCCNSITDCLVVPPNGGGLRTRN